MNNILYSNSINEIPPVGVVVYTTPDQTAMELYKDGDLIVSYFVEEFCEEVGISSVDRVLVRDKFVEYCYNEEWV